MKKTKVNMYTIIIVFFVLFMTMMAMACDDLINSVKKMDKDITSSEVSQDEGGDTDGQGTTNKVPEVQSNSRKNQNPISEIKKSPPSFKELPPPRITEIYDTNYVKRHDEAAVVVGVVFNMDVSVVGVPIIVLDVDGTQYMAVYKPKYAGGYPRVLYFRIAGLKNSAISSSSVVRVMKNSLTLKFEDLINASIKGLGPKGKDAILTHDEQIIKM